MLETAAKCAEDVLAQSASSAAHAPTPRDTAADGACSGVLQGLVVCLGPAAARDGLGWQLGGEGWELSDGAALFGPEVYAIEQDFENELAAFEVVERKVDEQ
eukprot:11449224-Prorocentrum_lima.AAC.1